MNFKLSLCFLMVCLSFTAFAQQAELSFEWEIKNPSRNAPITLLLKNNGASIDNNNWKIYFNAIHVPKIKNPDAQPYELHHVNGDLHYIQPTKKFKSFSKGETLSIELLFSDIRNYTELASGFFYVSDEKTKAVSKIVNANKPNPWIETAISENSFKQNVEINNAAQKNLIKILPTPVNYQEDKGFFTITATTTILSDSEFSKEVTLLQDELFKILGQKLKLETKGKSKKSIILKKDASLGNAYMLDISKKNITISANNATGVFYAIQSLKTLISPEYYAGTYPKIKVNAVHVLDSARFGHRALMIDVARNFLPKEEVIKTLDLMALYKLNTLHFHLNDDEGWRLQIPGLPELTDFGAKRAFNANSLPPSYGSGPFSENNSGTGFYSVQDFKEILSFARDRHIKVIPEIETPGHARAAIKSMDARYKHFMALGDEEKATEFLLNSNDQSVYRSVQGWNDHVIDVALPSTYKFLDKVINEIVAIYKDVDAPLELIHMGGDEVPAGVWMGSPAVKQLMKENTDLKDVNDLWRYYFKNVNQILAKHQLSLYGWEEIALMQDFSNGRKKLVTDPLIAGLNYHTDVWNNIVGTGAEDLAYRMANAGTKVVLSNVTNMYLDMAYNKSFFEHGMNWAGYLDIDKPYKFIPYNYYKSIHENEYGDPVSQKTFDDKVKLEEKAKSNIVGLQAALWSETITDVSTFEYLLLPKLLGLAERAWSKDPSWSYIEGDILENEQYKSDYAEFINRVGKRELPRLNVYAGGFNYRIPEVGTQIIDGKAHANSQYPEMTIRYTTDGSIPDENSLVYTTPLPNTTKLAFRLFNNKGRGGKTVAIGN